MDYLKTADTVTGAIGSTTVGGGTRTGLLVDGTNPLNASKNWAQYYNMLIEENVYVIEQAGLVPDKENWHQMAQAISIIAANSATNGWPAGSLWQFAQGVMPPYFIYCNGGAVSRTTYAKLFAAIGTIYGVGDGSTTFNVPDFRGVFLRGLDNGRGIDSGRVLGSYQSDAIQNITGYINAIQNHDVPFLAGAGGAFVQSDDGTLGNDNSGGSPGFNVTFDASRVVRASSETRPVNVAVLIGIKY